MRGSGAQSLWQLPVSYTAHSLCVAVTYTDVRGEGGELLANSATTERALRCLTSDCMPGNCRRTPVVTILERVWYIPRETATLNFVRYEHPGGWRSALNFVTEV